MDTKYMTALKENAFYNELLNSYCKEFGYLFDVPNQKPGVDNKYQCTASIAHNVFRFKDAFLKRGPRKYKRRIVINYDFGTNWNTKIVPLLEKEEIQEAITEGCLLLGANEDKVSIPAYHCPSDAYATLIMDMQNEFFNNGKTFDISDDLKEDYERYLQLRELEDEDINDHPEFFELQDKIFYSQFDKKTHISSYIIIGACHEWNSTFGFELAKLVEPDEEWYVKHGPNHTTVINREHTKCFDIIKWGIEYLNHYCGLTDRKPHDPTLGGSGSYEYAFGLGEETVNVFARILQCSLSNHKLVPTKKYHCDTQRYNSVVLPILRKYVNTVEQSI